jgi:transketolase
MGVVVVQGTSTTNNLLTLLPAFDEQGINVKIVAAISPQLFALQEESYRENVFSKADRLDAMAVTNRARKLMIDWIDHGFGMDHSICADWDDRWRTGGTLDEVVEEAHLSSHWILEGIKRFVGARAAHFSTLKQRIERIESESR